MTEHDELREALQDAHLPTLALTLAHLTGENRWLQDPYRPTPPRGGEEHAGGGLSEEVQQQLREQAFEALAPILDGAATAEDPAQETLCDWLSISLGGEPGVVGHEYAGLLAEELGTATRAVPVEDPPPADEFHVLIIGSGFSGLCAAANLKRAGIAFTMLERHEEIGGTWLKNQYPACGVDTPSHLYSLSFAQNPNWTRYFAKRDELYGYLEQIITDHDLRSHVRCDREVQSATYEAEGRWVVETQSSTGEQETFAGNVVICGVGFFNEPVKPSIAGLESFEGPVIHTARWDHDVSLEGKRVAVIGTGASAMQLVPASADAAEHITVFQRSPQWALPNGNVFRDVAEGNRWLMQHVPHYLGWYRLRLFWIFGDLLHPALQVDPEWEHPERSISKINDRHRQFLEKYIESELGDRADELREKCVPPYPPYGKRPLLDNNWFRTMARDDVTLVTDAVTEVTASGVVTAAGESFDADVLVLATGFHARAVLGGAVVTGRSGRTLREAWGEDDAKAYLGMSVADFPNFYFLLGPNTFAAHGGSAALSIEMEMRYVSKLIAFLVREDVAAVDLRQDVYDAYQEELDSTLETTIWSHRGMTTYYRNSKGRIVIPMPWTNVDYWHRTYEPDMSDYHVLEKVTA